MLSVSVNRGESERVLCQCDFVSFQLLFLLLFGTFLFPSLFSSCTYTFIHIYTSTQQAAAALLPLLLRTSVGLYGSEWQVCLCVCVYVYVLEGPVCSIWLPCFLYSYIYILPLPPLTQLEIIFFPSTPTTTTNNK